MADLVKQSAESVRKALKAGVEPATGVAIVAAMMVGFGLIMSVIKMQAPPQVKKGMANPYVEPFINLLPMAIMAAGVSTYIIDGWMARSPGSWGSARVKFAKRVAIFAPLMVLILYVVNWANGRLGSYVSYAQQSDVEKALCKKYIDEAVAKLNADKAAMSKPQDAAEQISEADGTGVAPEDSAAQPSDASVPSNSA